jgi:Ca2+-binding EF-hand superfamily protein
MEKIRNKIKSRGARGIMGLGRTFRIYDDDNSKTLCADECRKAFSELRINLTPDEQKRAFRIFDRDGSKTIDYEEFLRQVRGEMNDFRKNYAM